ncbi:MAG: helix-turn-helix transcriptional regulator [Peptococcaceae bacterium]|nr:helix-turn-helix transcriptional regulator [Peptococcaceae bacterium]
MKIYWYEGKKNIIGDRVRVLRKEKGISQKTLAEQLQLLGFDFNDLTILRIETGKRFVADYELMALADFFNVSSDYLLGRIK